MSKPNDAAARRAVKPVICYPPETLPAPDLELYAKARGSAEKISEVIVPPREAASIDVPAGCF